MNSGDLVDTMAFHPVTLEALFIARVYRNKFIHQPGHLSRASFSTGTVSFFYAFMAQHMVRQTLKGGRMKLTFKKSFLVLLRFA